MICKNMKVKNSVVEIGNSLRDEMLSLDNRGDNFFSSELTLISNFKHIKDHARLGQHFRTPDHRLIYVKEGTARISFNYKEYDLEPGMLIITHRGSVITPLRYGSDYNPQSMAFNFPDVEFSAIVPMKDVVLKLNPTDKKIVGGYFDLTHTLLSGIVIDDRCVQLLVKSLLVYLVENHVNKIVSGFSRKKALSERFVREVMTNFDVNNHTADYYADKLGVSSNYLGAVVKQETGSTILKWVNRRKVLEIERMLALNMTLKQISEELLFSEACHVARFYKRETGKTTKDYKYQICEANNEEYSDVFSNDENE